MPDLSPEEKQRIIQALKDRGATHPCPRCGNNSFDLVGGYFNHFIQHTFGNVNLGGPSIPTAVIACGRCGWLSEHALGTLGLLPPQPDKAGEAKP